MNDKELLNKIRDGMKDIEVPESLEPNNIKIKLENNRNKNIRNRKRNIFIASVAAVTIFILGIVSIATSHRGNVLSKDEKVGKSVASINTAKDYKSLYEVLSEVDKEDFRDSISDFSKSDAFIKGDINETVENSSSKKEDYSETNSQVSGIEEDDIVKTDGEYIYFTKGDIISNINIAKVNKGEINLTSTISLEDLDIETNDAVPVSMYVYKDILVYYLNDSLVIDEENYYIKNTTKIVLIDVSNKDKPKLISIMEQDGDYNTSRLVDGILYSFSNYYIYNLSGYREKENYVPMINGEYINCNNIFIPERIDSKSYIVMTSLDLNNPDSFIDEKAVLGSSNVFYMSENNFYAVSSLSGKCESEILKFSYNKGKFQGVARNFISGHLNNQFSLDEKDGYLRVVGTKYTNNNKSNSEILGYDISDEINEQVNYLYVLDEKLNIVGSVDNLAKGEKIYSARFIGDMAYFVTYKNVDPLFSVDLSNPKNPKVLGALKIPGFSNYLHPYGDNLLLGIGEEIDPETNNFLGIKISMFDISNPENVVEKDKMIFKEYDNSQALYNHKAVLVDENRKIIGFYMEGYDNSSLEEYNDYCLFTYDEEKGFSKLMQHRYNEQYYDAVRGLYIGEYLYIVNSEEGIVSYSLNDYKKVSEFKIYK